MTNAKRYMTTFSQRPFETWKIIEENIQPYWNHLKVSERNYYRKVLDEIYALFEVDAISRKRDDWMGYICLDFTVRCLN